MLIESAETRAAVGGAARESIVSRYSVASQREAYLGLLHDVLGA